MNDLEIRKTVGDIFFVISALIAVWTIMVVVFYIPLLVDIEKGEVTPMKEHIWILWVTLIGIWISKAFNRVSKALDYE